MRANSLRLGMLLLSGALLACGESSVSPDPAAPNALPCLVGQSACFDRIPIANGVYLPLYRSYSLSEPNTKVTEAVIFVHGTDRNANGYFETMIAATQQSGRAQEVLVVAPRFQLLSDGPAPDEAYWTDSGWKKGHLSVTGGPTPRVSSYAAIDRIVSALADRSNFPNLTHITVAGHSAGGQVVHRYAAGSRAQGTVSGVTFRYIVANPSTYLYIDKTRPAESGFAVPDSVACPDFDTWHYGFSDLNSYMMALPVSQAVTQLLARDVRILIGSADVGSAQLDVTCGANLQGANRFDRGQKLIRFMDARYPGHKHVEMIVPAVAHSSRGMFTSSVGWKALWER